MATDDFREILFVLHDIRKNDYLISGKHEAGTSIFEKAKPAILNFPVLVSDAISLEDLSMVNKALEREYATVVRLAMGLDDVIDTNDGRFHNKREYVSKFHTNDYYSANTDINKLFEEVNYENLKAYNESELKEFTKKDMLAESLGLNMSNLNDMTNKNNHNFVNLSESGRKITRTRTTTTRSAQVSTDDSTEWDDQGIKNYSTKTTRKNPYTETHEDEKDEVTLQIRTDYMDYSKQLVDNDIKKANELIPTTLDITVYQNMGNGEVISDHILLGIKCIAHKVSSKEMVDNIVKTLDLKKNFFRFIQWTTGEIKFFKDYLLCLDELKREALKSHSKDQSALWFRSLKNRATISRIRSALNLKNQLIPNATLVLTMDEIDYMRNMYRIDLLKDTKIVRQLMKIYFLIGFVIIDPSAEISYFLFDGFDKYQMFSFNSLERENRNQGNDIKSLVSLMSKF